MEKQSIEIYSEIWKEIDKSDRIVIVSHKNPDGDAVGSSLALYHFLGKEKQCHVISPDVYPQFLSWLPGSDDILIFENEVEKCRNIIEDADLFFFVDFNDIDRIKEIKAVVNGSSATKILIDHHPDPHDFADLMISDTSVSSTSELIYRLLQSGANRDVSKQIAECLYVGIMTDTGSFNYNSSNPFTFEVVSSLLETGINKDAIYSKVYDNFSESRMRLMGYCLLEKMEVFTESKTAFISITRDELGVYNYELGDTEGFVNIPLSIKGVVFSALFIEKEDHIKISFRSKGDFAANTFAVKNFNGGGHKNAAGGYANDTMENTINKFKELMLDNKDL